MFSNYLKTNFTVILAFSVIVIYLIASIFSNGYHHPDEHFQLIEFAGLKAGWNNDTDLTWEYNYLLRPSLQPYIALVIIRLGEFIGLKTPFAIATLLRMLTGIFVLSSIRYYALSLKTQINKRHWMMFLLLSFCLWFLPIINVRFSSETWSGMFLIIALGLINKNTENPWHYFIVGVLLGIMFEFRFQMALCIVGIFAWLAVYNKAYKSILKASLGIIAVVLLATVLDYYYYGMLTFVPYNYFKTNIIDKVAGNYGLLPWYFYFVEIVTRLTIPIGIISSIAFVFVILFNKKSIIVWCIIPYLLIHSIIGHKETRFLFPIANLLPFIIVNGFECFDNRFNIFSKYYWGKIILYGLILINTIGLLFIFKPAGFGQVHLAEKIYDDYYNGHPIDVYSFYYGPFSFGTVQGAVSRFYTSDKINVYTIYDRFIPYAYSATTLVTVPAFDVYNKKKIEGQGYVLKAKSIPDWFHYLNIFYNVYDEKYMLLLYVK
ncbi:hypothetical protein [Mucilaginibacter sp. UYCu711]|uniref:hypothetical protein n=1 Tax=Mucilaginibacter sp. UYCu711 TaxID=3156339 RepID=UPI003D1BDCFD